ncbi:hypothetical protein DEO72_LG2g3639 [Vigna unguiculata]|uniref:Uncharacterized protein n=1 Tax=Vigna unguiculata TaxID=3917 RepID=A0A4D6L4B4_VIGUN|nr:hypothetical protein DEO72_LG2g3639 [Vigna unguiculata]
MASLRSYGSVGKKNLNLFQTLRREQAKKSRNAGNTEGIGKDLKKVRSVLLEPKSTSGTKKPKSCLIELSEATIRRDIDIHLPESVISSMDNMEPNAMIKAMLEFNNKALILGRRVGTLLQKELKEGGRVKVQKLQEELTTQAAKHEEKKATWEKEWEE